MADDFFADMHFDGKSALTEYGLDLQYCVLSAPVRKRSMVSVPCMDGSVDLLSYLGDARYEDRALRAEFTARGDVRATVSQLIKDLEGRRVRIALPLDLDHYMEGWVHICSAGYFNGAGVVITATCDPWRYPVAADGEAIL